MVAAERLVLRLEPRTLDLATALPLLRRHRLYSALLAVRATRGDHVSSVEEVSRRGVPFLEYTSPGGVGAVERGGGKGGRGDSR